MTHIMMIKKDTTFSLNNVTSCYCMQHDGTTTHAVLAKIKCRPTAKRDPPPKCGNGFDTSHLPFAKGHVIALELGGSDDPHNVVPQFEDWQGKRNGEWRQMEESVSKFPGHVMLVTIEYNRNGQPENHELAVAEFQKDRLREWHDPRIPDTFEVTVWNSTEDPKDIDENNDAEFIAMIGRLKRMNPVYKRSWSLGVGLPRPDRDNYVTQEAVTIADDLWKAEPQKPEFVQFMLQENSVPQIRERLHNVAGVQPAEANIQAFPILHAYVEGLTRPQVRKRMKAMDKDGLKRAKSDLIGVSPSDPPPKKRPNK